MVAEVRALVADGVLEVTLLGQNVNAYGNDLRGRRPARPSPVCSPSSTASPGCAGCASRPRTRATCPTSSCRRWPSLPTVCEHLHLPAQSGSDRVLSAMGRGYTMDWYLRRVDALRAAVPDIAITTDLMVGFPGETDDDFADTLRLVETAGFDASFTFVYSPRPGTAAATLPDQVKPDVARERIGRLVEVTQQREPQTPRRRGRTRGRGARRGREPARRRSAAAALVRTSP